MAVVGYGYWGPNIVRNVLECPDLRLVALCEPDRGQAELFGCRYAGVTVYESLDEALGDPDVEAVAIATPPRSHAELATRALASGRHVLVEKPLATSAAEAALLVDEAQGRGLVLMPGHTFLYSPPVNTVRDLISSGELGDVHIITSSRMNLGKYQVDGVVWDLAPHDLSILLYWLDRPVVRVVASGQDVFRDGVPETAFITLCFEGGAKANIQISWLAPCKVRQTVVIGSRRMVHYDDTAGDEAVRVYDRGMDLEQPPGNFGEYRLTYRSGAMIAPWIAPAEPLALELRDFARAIRTGEEPRSNARLGLEIVRVVEAIETSVRRGSRPVRVDPLPGSAAMPALDAPGIAASSSAALR